MIVEIHFILLVVNDIYMNTNTNTNICISTRILVIISLVYIKYPLLYVYVYRSISSHIIVCIRKFL